MPVNVVRRRMDRRFVDSPRSNVKDPGLFAVHPHRDLLAHEDSLSNGNEEAVRWQSRDAGKPYVEEGFTADRFEA